MEEVGKVQRGPKGSLTPFQRVSQSLAIKKPHSCASTGSLQGFYRMFWDFYRMFRNGIFEDGWRKEDEGVGMEVR